MKIPRLQYNLKVAQLSELRRQEHVLIWVSSLFNAVLNGVEDYDALYQQSEDCQSDLIDIENAIASLE